MHNITDKCHFAINIWDINSAKAVIDAAASMQQDIILQTSAAIYKALPIKQFYHFSKDYACSKGIMAYLNLDHGKEPDMIKDAIDNGWDMVMIDASSKPLDQNIAVTNKIVDYAHKHGILVEAEVGQVRGTEEEITVRRSVIASKEDIKLFLDSTDIDLIAAAFGNAHGEYKGKPELQYDLVEYTTGLGKPFAVHGGSGLSDEILGRLIAINGVKKINISTDLKLAYRRGMIKSIEMQLLSQDNFQAAKVESVIQESMRNAVISKLRLLSETPAFEP